MSLGIEGQFTTILADPPWRFKNSTGKVAPEHKRLFRYVGMKTRDIAAMPVGDLALPHSHLWLWTPNAMLPDALEVMAAWGYRYTTNLVWYKVRQDGGPDGRGCGFYMRNVTEMLLLGVKGKLRTLKPGRTQVNLHASRTRGHSRKPDEIYGLIEALSPGPYLELFARHERAGWMQWGDQLQVADST